MASEGLHRCCSYVETCSPSQTCSCLVVCCSGGRCHSRWSPGPSLGQRQHSMASSSSWLDMSGGYDPTSGRPSWISVGWACHGGPLRSPVASFAPLEPGPPELPALLQSGVDVPHLWVRPTQCQHHLLPTTPQLPTFVETGTLATWGMTSDGLPCGLAP